MDIEDANKSVQPTPWDVACFFLGRKLVYVWGYPWLS